MTEAIRKGGRFSSLRTLQGQIKEDVLPEQSYEEDLISEDIQNPLAKITSQLNLKQEIEQPAIKSGSGRPRGRRSNPDYTQISAYIPLDLLLEIQSELDQERRAQRKRSGMYVSELVEKVLTDWLKQRKAEKSK
jgi:hypothetical protein